MFDNDIRVEPVPARVLELCKLVEENACSVDEIREKIEPSSFDSNKSTKYFNYIKGAAIELRLIREDGESLFFIGDKEAIKNVDSFRRYCNSFVWQKKNTRFYKLAETFLDSNDQWLKYKTFSGNEVLTLVRKTTGDNGFMNTSLLGERFWLSFLGFGYIQDTGDSFTFLPNMYLALKDFIILSNIEKNKEITIGDFIAKIYDLASVSLNGVYKSHSFNLAFSNGLRQLHDNKEIVLKRNNDSKEMWNLWKMSSHEISKEISHIVIKGVK